MEYRHNAMGINSIDAFLNIRGNMNNDRRDVYFVRSVGEVSDIKKRVEDIDKKMNELVRQKKLAYIRINKIPQFVKPEDTKYYSDLYGVIETNYNNVQFKNIEKNNMLLKAIKNACSQVSDIYIGSREHVSETMKKNLLVKLLFWLDSEMSKPLSEWTENKYVKVIADNVGKEQEYIFYLFLTYLGCDVLLINNRKEITVSNELLKYSSSFKIGPFGSTYFSEYVSHEEVKSSEFNDVVRNENSCNVLVIPEHPKRKNRTIIESVNVTSGQRSVRGEMSFEELARLASSIVLIAIHDRTGEVVGTGSGIMIGTKGYILTNNHVASGGCYYSVRIEDDDEVYTTREVIKYNSTTDLAIIRINKILKPLKIYDGKKALVRGQKVVAIGSPLGLFNSVSDGIISGFRTINDVDMIQFTAPISHGSSGGAVLNMFGEVVGISTAGIDSGQNINLAIGYENIKFFANGFMI